MMTDAQMVAILRRIAGEARAYGPVCVTADAVTRIADRLAELATENRRLREELVAAELRGVK